MSWVRYPLKVSADVLTMELMETQNKKQGARCYNIAIDVTLLLIPAVFLSLHVQHKNLLNPVNVRNEAQSSTVPWLEGAGQCILEIASVVYSENATSRYANWCVCLHILWRWVKIVCIEVCTKQCNDWYGAWHHEFTHTVLVAKSSMKD